MDINPATFPENVILDKVNLPILSKKNINLNILRLDKIHTEISGNKWFKLKYFFKQLTEDNYQGIVTLGGPWSNHLAATAAAAKLLSIETIGIIRGQHWEHHLTPTLLYCKQMGMKLVFVKNNIYKNRYEHSFLTTIAADFPNYLYIPEGGNSPLGIKGAMEIYNFIPNDCTHIALAVGTGTTFSGIANCLKQSQNILGFSAIKNGHYLLNIIKNQVPKQNHPLLEMNFDYHFNGFGKTTPELISFINDFYSKTNILLDIVYTGKMIFGILDLIQNNHFPTNSNITAIHTGGLQGNESIRKQLIF